MAKVKAYMLVALSIQINGKVYKKENEDIFDTDTFSAEMLAENKKRGFLEEVSGKKVDAILKEKAAIKDAEEKRIAAVNKAIADRKEQLANPNLDQEAAEKEAAEKEALKGTSMEEGVNVAQATEKINSFDSVEEVNKYAGADTRKGVIAAVKEKAASLEAAQ